MRKLVISGAGGHGKVVLEIARATGLFSEIVFVDDSYVGSPFVRPVKDLRPAGRCLFYAGYQPGDDMKSELFG